MDDPRDRDGEDRTDDAPSGDEEKQPEPVLQTVGRWNMDDRQSADSEEEKQPEPVLQTIGRWTKDFGSLEESVAKIIDKRPEPDDEPETLALGSKSSGFRPDGAPPPPSEPAAAPKAPPMARTESSDMLTAPKAPPLSSQPAPKAPPMSPQPEPNVAPTSGGAPPPSGEFLAPKRQPMGRPPAPSEELLVPQPPPMAVVSPPQAAPPMSGAAEEGEAMSDAAQRLAASVASGAPRFSSFEFSVNLTDLLATYWVRRVDAMSRDEAGDPKQDYILVLQRAKAIHEADDTLDRDTMVQDLRQVADDLDADKIPFFAPSLKRAELHFVQAVHDLSLALIHYKLATRLENVADRLVMLTSTTGAQGCLTAALNRFGGVDVPEAVSNYVEMLQLKLQLEEENCRHLLAKKG